ncbi:hypothetical protein L9F63_012819 [Diploptera punctata]|uniref:Dynein axonemal intermediate chain 4 n=1 Tax=Diploptera punctata TaxID=6984 RepID=A0AAD8ABH8_DIPPU|nr:hypothetical protein L9F63_012819 [Diploptera punctata]
MPVNEKRANAINLIFGDSLTELRSSSDLSVSIFDSISSMDISDLQIDKREFRGPSVHLLYGTGALFSTKRSLDLSLQIETIKKAASVQSVPSQEYFFERRGEWRRYPEAQRVKYRSTDVVVITARETPTFFLLDIPNYTAWVGTKEGLQIEADNQHHSYMTAGKGRFTKYASIQTQTFNASFKDKWALNWHVKTESKSTFVNDWVMFDDKKEFEEINKEQEIGFKDSLPAVKSEVKMDKSENKMEIVNKQMAPEEQFAKIVQSKAFLDACAKMERLLASNVYCEQQKMFRGLMQQDPLRMDVEFKYTAKILWSFTSDYVNGRTVSGVCWNPINTDLIAVGYGKYFYHEHINGLVCCWNIKNPTQPERKFNFKSPVTAVNFSKDRPNLLGCGFDDGIVIILDISSTTKTIIAQSNSESSPSYQPVWTLIWFHSEDYQKGQEQIMTCCEDGRICRYTREIMLNCFTMMRVSRREGKVKGIDQTRKCRAHDIPVSRNPAALILTRHPTDPNIYYVGTDEGCIHKCSINYLHHHIDIFQAHAGPVYSMEFSPFCSKLFLTCGADWCVRIWCEGIEEPLLTLKATMEAVQDARWSPINSTVLASVSGNQLHFWDIRRKLLVPASTTVTSCENINILLAFTVSGLNVVVGDNSGAVHMYGLEDMPFPPFYQESMLVRAIKRALTTRPNLLKALKKIGKPFL